MIDEKFVDLMNTELDGVNSARESAELQKYLASDQDARKYFDELRAVCRAVDAERDEEPPPDLEQKIISSIPFGRYSSSRTDSRGGDWLDKWIFMRRLKYAGVFAAGIIIGIIAYTIFGYGDGGGESFDNSLMYGTMRSVKTTDAFKQIQSAVIDLEDINGDIRIHESKHAMLAEVSLNSPGEIEWALQFDEKYLSFEGFRQLDGQDCEIAAARTETRIHQNGDNKYILFFSNKDRSTTSLAFKVFSADQKLLYETNLIPVAAD